VALSGTGEVDDAASENPEVKSDESDTKVQGVSFHSDTKNEDGQKQKRPRTSR